MSALTFTLKAKPSHRIDCSALTPDKLAGLSTEQIAHLRLGNAGHVSDYFELSGSDCQTIVLDGNGEMLDFIGARMKSGTIICRSNVGDRLGDQMRRGLILVEGNAGDYAASRMIAGTIGIYGEVGAYLGYGMKRGTILLSRTPKLTATMQDCGTHTLPFLHLLIKALAPLETRFSAILSTRAQRYAGDTGANGRGEVLVFNQQ